MASSSKQRSARRKSAVQVLPTPTASTPTAAPASGPVGEYTPRALPASVARVIAKRASGEIRRKNLNVDQGLLDQARARLGLKTETEAVELGLGALLELAEFRAAMVDGFDRLMEVGGLGYVEGEEMDFTGFRTDAPDGR